jgi:hypothetical protein
LPIESQNITAVDQCGLIKGRQYIVGYPEIIAINMNDIVALRASLGLNYEPRANPYY